MLKHLIGGLAAFGLAALATNAEAGKLEDVLARGKLIVVAVPSDEVRIRASGAGEPLGEELERRRAAEQGGHGRRQVRSRLRFPPAQELPRLKD